MIVTIHFWDGHKQDVECPEGTKWIEITPYFGGIWAHRTKPARDQYHTFYVSYLEKHIGNVSDDRKPAKEGHTLSQLLKVEEV